MYYRACALKQMFWGGFIDVVVTRTTIFAGRCTKLLLDYSFFFLQTRENPDAHMMVKAVSLLFDFIYSQIQLQLISARSGTRTSAFTRLLICAAFFDCYNMGN